MSLVKINWHPDEDGLRRFGTAMIVGFSAIGIVLLWFGKPLTYPLICFIVGAVTGMLGLTGTKAALPVYWLWMGAAWCMGQLMSRLALALFFFGMITPMAFLMRLLGRDRLRLRRAERPTYWVDAAPQPAEPRRYQRQF
jgi:hypothetical protein